MSAAGVDPTQTQPAKRLKNSEQKVCIVVQCRARDEMIDNIYIVDLNNLKPSSSSLRRRASFQLTGNYPFAAAHIVLDSTLYIFGGGSRQLCFSYDLSPMLRDADSDNRTCILNFTSMMGDMYNTAIQRIPSLPSIMDFPSAVVVGAAQICVFSTCLYRSEPNFNVYDLVTKTWSSLPEPPIEFDKDKPCEVEVYCVDENFVFFISIRLKGTFGIDLRQPFRSEQLNWVRYDFPDLQGQTGRGALAVLKIGDLILTPSAGVYDVDGNTVVLPPHRLSPGPVPEGRDFVSRADTAIVHLPNERMRVCIVEIGLSGCHVGADIDPVLELTLLDYDDVDVDDPATSSTIKFRPILRDYSMFLLDPRINTFNLKIVGACPV